MDSSLRTDEKLDDEELNPTNLHEPLIGSSSLPTRAISTGKSESSDPTHPDTGGELPQLLLKMKDGSDNKTQDNQKHDKSAISDSPDGEESIPGILRARNHNNRTSTNGRRRSKRQISIKKHDYGRESDYLEGDNNAVDTDETEERNSKRKRRKKESDGNASLANLVRAATNTELLEEESQSSDDVLTNLDRLSNHIRELLSNNEEFVRRKQDILMIGRSPRSGRLQRISSTVDNVLHNMEDQRKTLLEILNIAGGLQRNVRQLVSEKD